MCAHIGMHTQTLMWWCDVSSRTFPSPSHLLEWIVSRPMWSHSYYIRDPRMLFNTKVLDSSSINGFQKIIFRIKSYDPTCWDITDHVQVPFLPHFSPANPANPLKVPVPICEEWQAAEASRSPSFGLIGRILVVRSWEESWGRSCLDDRREV